MSRHRSLAIPAIVALLVLMATATAVAALSIEAPLCDGVKLRTGPTTSYPIKAAVGPSVTLTVVDEVSGSWWQSLCAGHVVSGKTWAKISVIDGATAQSRFGVPYVYAATGLLQVLATDSETPSVASTSPPASPSATPTTAPTVTPTESPAPSDTAPPPPATPTPSPPVATASAGSAVPIAPNQTGSSSNPINGPAATVVLILALLSTTLSWVAVADRRRRRSRRVATPESVPSARLDDVLH